MSSSVTARWVELPFKGFEGKRAFGTGFTLFENDAPRFTMVGGAGEPRNLTVETTGITVSTLNRTWVDRDGLSNHRLHTSGAHSLYLPRSRGAKPVHCNLLVSNSNNSKNVWLPSTTETYTQLHVLSTDQKRWVPVDLSGLCRDALSPKSAGMNGKEGGAAGSAWPDDEETAALLAPIARIGGATTVVGGTRLLLFGGLTSRRHIEAHGTTAPLLAFEEAAMKSKSSSSSAATGSARSPVFLNDLAYFSWNNCLFQDLDDAAKAEKRKGLADPAQHKQNEKLVEDPGLLRPSASILQTPTMLTPQACKLAYPSIFAAEAASDQEEIDKKLIIEGSKVGYIERKQEGLLASYGQVFPKASPPRAFEGQAPCPRAFAQLVTVASQARSGVKSRSKGAGGAGAAVEEPLGFRVILFGGMTYGGRLLNDIHVLDLMSNDFNNRWSTPIIRISLPRAVVSGSTSSSSSSASSAGGSLLLPLASCFPPSVSDSKLLHNKQGSRLAVDATAAVDGSQAQLDALSALCPTSLEGRAFGSGVAVTHTDPSINSAGGRMMIVFGGRKEPEKGKYLDDYAELSPYTWASHFYRPSSENNNDNGNDGGHEGLMINSAASCVDTMDTLSLDLFTERDTTASNASRSAGAGAGGKRGQAPPSAASSSSSSPFSIVVVKRHDWDQATWGLVAGRSVGAGTSVGAIFPTPRSGMQVMPINPASIPPSIASAASSSSSSESSGYHHWKWLDDLYRLHVEGAGGSITTGGGDGGTVSVGTKRSRASLSSSSSAPSGLLAADGSGEELPSTWAKDVMGKSEFFLVFGGATMKAAGASSASSSSSSSSSVAGTKAGAGSSAARGGSNSSTEEGIAALAAAGPYDYYNDLYLLQVIVSTLDSTTGKQFPQLPRLPQQAATYGLENCGVSSTSAGMTASKLIKALVGGSSSSSSSAAVSPSLLVAPAGAAASGAAAAAGGGGTKRMKLVDGSSSSSSSAVAVAATKGGGAAGKKSKAQHNEDDEADDLDEGDEDQGVGGGYGAAAAAARHQQQQQAPRERERSRSRSRSRSRTRGGSGTDSSGAAAAAGGAAMPGAVAAAAMVTEQEKQGVVAALKLLSNFLGVDAGAGAGAAGGAGGAVMMVPYQQQPPLPWAAAAPPPPPPPPPINVDALADAVIAKMTGNSSSSSGAAGGMGTGGGGALRPMVATAVSNALGNYFQHNTVPLPGHLSSSVVLTVDKARHIFEDGVRSLVETSSRDTVSAITREVKASILAAISNEQKQRREDSNDHLKAIKAMLSQRSAETESQTATIQQQLQIERQRTADAEAQLSVYKRRLEESERARAEDEQRLRNEKDKLVEVRAELKVAKESLSRVEGELERAANENRNMTAELTKFRAILSQLGGLAGASSGSSSGGAGGYGAAGLGGGR
jgi:hypothetical protein